MGLGGDLRKIAKKRKQTIDQVYRSVMFDMGNQIITSSPVQTGAFRANWMAAINAGDFTFDKDKTNVASSSGRLTAKMAMLSTAESFYFTNSMPYAKDIEDGSSEYAPSGVVRVTLNDFKSIVQLRVRQLR